MAKLLPIILFFIPFVSNAQKTNFSITISFNQVAPAKHVYVFMNNERRIDTLAYPLNDTLIYHGTINNPGTFQIAADSIPSKYVWIDSVPVSFTLSAKRSNYGNSYFEISNLRGSDDTRALFEMTQPKSFSSGIISASLKKEERDSILNKFRFERYAAPYKTIDSLFSIRPNSPIIPYYIRFYQRTLGPDSAALFYKRLNNRLQISDEGLKIKEFLDQCVLLKPGTIIQDFTMRNQKGKKQSLYSVSSKYILLDFWASWCMPCRAENPTLVKAYEKYHDKGLEIIGISLDEDKHDWLKAIEKDQLEWLHVSELKGWANKIAEKYKISSVPFTILLDHNYRVIAVNVRVADLDALFNGRFQPFF